MKTTIDTIITQAEARRILKRFNYLLKKDGDEFEVYPKGQRGAKSYFTDDLTDAISTARAQSNRNFAVALSHITQPQFDAEVVDALKQWHDQYQAEWHEKLLHAWYSGDYGYKFATTNVSSTLQRLRNHGAGGADNGHEFLTFIITILKQVS